MKTTVKGVSAGVTLSGACKRMCVLCVNVCVHVCIMSD